MSETSNAPVQYHFNLSEARPFSPGHYYIPPVPVLTAFRETPLHVCEKYGCWDLQRVVTEKANLLLRSQKDLEVETGWEQLIVQIGPTQFVCINNRSLYAYANTPDDAWQILVDFDKQYALAQTSHGSFHLVRTDDGNISSEVVELTKDQNFSDETLALHYGSDFTEWHHQFANLLSNKPNGLSIFEGSPGTGKTSYLRLLMGKLKNTHRFYFIPPNYLYILTQTRFIGFWASQRRTYKDRQFVVILEDSEAVLMTRAADNRDEVSAILNLTDGMLADFLRLQIICTINCHSSKLDEALLRPGRLMSHRVFNRLDYAEASRLAESLGKELPANRDYSLAEVFVGLNNEQKAQPRIGFASNA